MSPVPQGITNMSDLENLQLQLALAAAAAHQQQQQQQQQANGKPAAQDQPQLPQQAQQKKTQPNEPQPQPQTQQQQQEQQLPAIPNIYTNAAALQQAALLQAALINQQKAQLLQQQQHQQGQQKGAQQLPEGAQQQKQQPQTEHVDLPVQQLQRANPLPGNPRPPTPSANPRPNGAGVGVNNNANIPNVARMTTHTIDQTSLLCDTILTKELSELKLADPMALIKLRERTQALYRKLDDTIVKVTPFTRYSRDTVDACIAKFRNYTFQRMATLCDYNLMPIMKKQVREALRAERGDIALGMLASLLTVFIQYVPKLKDDQGSAREFMEEWIGYAFESVVEMPDEWDGDPAVVDELIRIMGECGPYRTVGGFFDLQEQLEALIDGYDSDCY